MRAFKLTDAIGDWEFQLREGRPVVVGRAMTSDLAIYEPTVSRRHAEVVVEGGNVSVRDLGSTNGTFVDRNRVTGVAVAQDGDTVSFGNVELRLREVPPPASQEERVEGGPPWTGQYLPRRLALFREAPQLRLVVRVLEAGRQSGDPTLFRYSCEILATRFRDLGPNPQPGERFVASEPSGAPGWSLERLDATTVDEAIIEADERMGATAGQWIR